MVFAGVDGIVTVSCVSIEALAANKDDDERGTEAGTDSEPVASIQVDCMSIPSPDDEAHNPPVQAPSSTPPLPKDATGGEVEGEGVAQ